jgi:RND family efflux transporter MFP subunit
MSEPLQFVGSTPPRPVGIYLLLLLAIAVLLAVWGEIDRVMVRAALGRDTARSAETTVVTVTPTRSAIGEALVLPGTVQAFVEAPIYARTNGYLKKWYTDIGATVKRGQLLAEIDAPELDQQLLQAQADLETARANETLSRSTDKRWRGLLATESVSEQDAEEKASDAAAKKSALASAAANLARLQELESFKRVVAPFDGIVTVRNTDIGALINAGQNTGSELFRMADIRRLRIYVQVPEIYAASIRPGQSAELRFAERSNKAYVAHTVRTSNALDPVLRTLQVELQMDNDTGGIFPGAYAEVHFKLNGPEDTLRLPANTLIFRAAGLQVATVDPTGHVKLKSIVQGRDLGSTVEVLSGVAVGDAVVLNPSDSVTDGEPVRVSPASASHAKDSGRQS